MIYTLKSCFQDDQINVGRQVELDIAKGFAIVFMVLCHFYEYFSDWMNPGLKILLYCVLGGPFSAAVFMFCMGISICYTRKKRPVDFFMRGLNLLWVGFLLQIFRQAVPDMIEEIARGTFFHEGSIWYFINNHIYFDVDILQFSGIFFIVFSILKKINLSRLNLCILAAVFLFAGQLLRDYRTYHLPLDYFLQYFIHNNPYVYFPFLNWFVFPALGYVFGTYWLHCDDKDTFFRTVTPICWIITAFYLGINFPDKGIYNDYLYFAVGVIDAVFILILVMGMLGLSYFISLKFTKFTQMMSWMSKHITSLYFAHWVLITNIYNIFYIHNGFSEFSLPDFLIIPLGLVLLAGSCVLVAWYHRLFTKKHKAA